MSSEPNDEPQQLARVDSNTLAVISSAEIDMQIATAHKFPRSLRKFKEEVLQMACLDVPTASECFYSLPRRDSDGQQRDIKGPSARFAEIVASAWGNCRAGARVVAEEEEFITAQGAFHDLERNVAISFEVRRRITGRNGKRYNADMIAVTGNAAASIALRNAVLKGVPKAFWASAFESAMKTAIGDAKTLETRRREEIEALAKLGVTAQRAYATLGIKGIEDVTLEHISTLIGLRGAIRDGDATIETAFPAPPGAATAKLAVTLGGKVTDEKERHIALAATINDLCRERRLKLEDVKQTLISMGIAKPPTRLVDLTPEDLRKLEVRLGFAKTPAATAAQTREHLMAELAVIVESKSYDPQLLAGWAQEQVGESDVLRMTDEQLGRFVQWLATPAGEG